MSNIYLKTLDQYGNFISEELDTSQRVDDVVKVATAVLDNAQIKALGDGAHPVTIVPAQGGIIAPIFAEAVYDFTAGAYGTVDPIATLNLGIAGGNSCLAWIAAQMLPDDSGPGYAHTTPFVNQNVTDAGLPALSGNVYGPYAGLVNQPLQLSVSDNNGDPFTAGHADNSMTVTVLYIVRTT